MEVKDEREAYQLQSQLGKFATLGVAVVSNLGYGSYANLNHDPSVHLNNPASFFDDLYEQSQQADFKKQIIEGLSDQEDIPFSLAIDVESKAYVVFSYGFNDFQRKFKVYTKKAKESFLDTTRNYALSVFKSYFATNGSFYGFSEVSGLSGVTGYGTATFTALEPSDILVDGHVYQNGIRPNNINTEDSPQGFHVEHDGQGMFFFGEGDANGGDGLGALTPLLLYKSEYNRVWKYGEGNLYHESMPIDPNNPAPITGSPPNHLKQYIVQRNSSQYIGQEEAKSGKNILAYHPQKDIFLQIVQEHKSATGKSLDYYRDALFNLGFQYAFGMDGSNSVMLYEYAGDKFHIMPAKHKYNSMVIGTVLGINE
jgi:hypothetical protein